MLDGCCWVLFFAFVPLFFAELLIEKAYLKPAFLIYFRSTLPAFFIWNICSTWWIAHVSLVGMLLITLLNALLMSTVWCLRYLVKRRFGEVTAFFSLPVFWLTFEFLHYNWSVQWPWLNLGNGFANAVELIQWFEYTGVLGGSLWVLLSNILIFLLIQGLRGKSFSNSLKIAVCLVFLIGVPLIWSLYRYSSYQEEGSSIEVLVLQPNIDPYTQKFSTWSPGKQVEKLVQLAQSSNLKSTDLIVAPETALPEMWEDSVFVQNSQLKPLFKLFETNPTVRIISGAFTLKRYGDNDVFSETARRSEDGKYLYDIFNSALLVDSSSNLQIGHKSILVSGVEKMPFQKYISFLNRFILQIGGSGGSLGMAKEPTLFYGKDAVKIGPIICFESVFGEYVGKSVRKGAEVLVVLTNDGWWKSSPGGKQHFSYSCIRAVETRRSIVRCANTGISGFINQRGDVVKKSRLNTTDILTSSVYLNDQFTFYTRNGDYLGRVAACLSAMILLYYIGNSCWKW